MRIHAVGVGSLGSLVSFHLRRTSRLLAENVFNVQTLPNQAAADFLPPPSDVGVSLRLRKSSFAKSVRDRADSSIIVERESQLQRESGFGVQWSGSFDQFGGAYTRSALTELTEAMPGSSVCERMGYPKGSLDVLLVTTRPQSTVMMLEPLVPFITPASTIILLQTSQGVLDQLIAQLFPDPKKRPNFILASTTHTAWQRGLLHTVHTGLGKIELGVVPNQHVGHDYERLRSGVGERDVMVEDDELRRIRDDGFGEGSGDEMTRSGRPSHGFEHFLPRSHRPDYSSRTDSRLAHHLSIPSAPFLDLGAIPSNAYTQTLIGSLALMLNLPLNVSWSPIRQYRIKALRHLVTSACIEPMTALASCRIGDLYGNRYAEQTMRDVCQEASDILQKVAEASLADALDHQAAAQTQQIDFPSSRPPRQMFQQDFLVSPDVLIGDPVMMEAPVLHATLRPAALFEEVLRRIRSTAPRFSNMYSELHNDHQRGKHSTEIYYINGYLGRLGRSLGVPTPVNDTLTSMIQLKSSHWNSSSWVSKEPQKK